MQSIFDKQQRSNFKQLTATTPHFFLLQASINSTWFGSLVECRPCRWANHGDLFINWVYRAECQQPDPAQPFNSTRCVLFGAAGPRHKFGGFCESNPVHRCNRPVQFGPWHQ